MTQLSQDPDKRLTPAERQFVKNIVRTHRIGQSALNAGFKHPSYGSKLLQKPAVQRYLEQVMERSGVTDEFLVRRLKQGLNAKYPAQYYKDGEYKQKTAPDFHTRQKYLDQAFRLKGSYAPEKTEVTRTDINITIDMRSAQGLLDADAITVEEFDELAAAEPAGLLEEHNGSGRDEAPRRARGEDEGLLCEEADQRQPDGGRSLGGEPRGEGVEGLAAPGGSEGSEVLHGECEVASA